MEKTTGNVSLRTPGTFPHPFSKAYWKQAASEFKKTNVLIFAALMIALRVVLKSFGIPIGVDLRINIAFFINAFGAMVFGPVVAIVAAAISDTLGCLLFPQGVYFFPFIFVEIAGSLTFALFLYRAEVSTKRVILSRFCIDFFVNIVLNTPIMMWYYQVVLGKYYALIDMPRIAKNLAAFPIESLLLILFLRATIPAAQKLKYVPSGIEKLRFTKRNIAVLVVLFLFGAATVGGYSVYSYNTTSLSASYGSTRAAMNIEARDIIITENESVGTAEEVVAVIESAYPKFMDDNITYSVAVYTIDTEVFDAKVSEAEEGSYTRDTLDGYSKSKAKADDSLVPAGYATYKVNKKTGEVTEFTFG